MTTDLPWRATNTIEDSETQSPSQMQSRDDGIQMYVFTKAYDDSELTNFLAIAGIFPLSQEVKKDYHGD
ncbi:MAG: hypothetical protein GY717_05490 [Rhodobacteraceae bacterium]|nr:hypothetical protein [Paracoccaceae bacterium]